MQANSTDAGASNVIQEFEGVWRAQCAEGRIPSAQDIEPSSIARLMPHLMVLEVCNAQGAAHMKTRLVGSAHRQVAASLHAGEILDDVDAAHAERARHAASTGQPVYWRTEGESATDVCVFPFSADGKTVDRVVSIVIGQPQRRRFDFG